MNSLGKKLLLFIDNYDVFDDYIGDIESLQCHVIITSRNKNIDTFIGYELGFLAFENCKKLFKQFYTLEDNMIMNEIIYKTGYLALAIELVAKTGQKMLLSLEEYYNKLEEKGFDIATLVQSNWDNNGKRLNAELAKHFSMVFDLTSFKNDLEALYILKNFSILPYLSVSQQEIIDWLSLNEERNSLVDLADAGWLQQHDSEYMMHPIISYTVKTETIPTIQECSSLVESLSDCIRVESGDNYLKSFQYLPYATSVAEYFREKYEMSDTLLLVNLYIRIAEIIRHNGEYDNSYRWGKASYDALNDVDEELKKTSFAENLIYNIMSEICLDMRNRNEESKDWAECAVMSDRENKSIDEIRISTSFHNLASAYIQMGQNGNALENIKIAITLRERNLSPKDIRLMNSYRNIAMIYRRLGDVKKAFLYQKRVIDFLKEFYADDPWHPDFPVAYNLYSFILRDLGEIDEAIKYQKEAIRIREHNNPEEPKLGINYNNLGKFYYNKNNLELAEEWQIKAIQTDLKHRGNKHPDVAADLFNYSQTLLAAGRIEEAVKRLKESRRIECENKGTEDRIKEIDELLQKYENINKVSEN